MNSPLAIWLGAAICAAGCGGAGLGPEVRADISTQMTSAQQPISTCYQAGLKTNRKLAGTMVLAFAAAPDTGQFQDIQVARDDLGDPLVRHCVLETPGKPTRAKPPATRLSIQSPIHFAPSP